MRASGPSEHGQRCVRHRTTLDSQSADKRPRKSQGPPMCRSLSRFYVRLTSYQLVWRREAQAAQVQALRDAREARLQGAAWARDRRDLARMARWVARHAHPHDDCGVSDHVSAWRALPLYRDQHSTRPRQFWLTPHGMAQVMSQMPMAQWRQQVLYSSQDIGPGIMTTFDHTFTMPLMQQQLAFGCYAANGQSLIETPTRVGLVSVGANR
jgi:hypothetical protein